MTREELIRNLRYTEKKHRNDIVNTFDTDISMMCSDVLKVLENCIEITDEMTNGDIIKLMFLNGTENIGRKKIYYSFYPNGDIEFNIT